MSSEPQTARCPMNLECQLTWRRGLLLGVLWASGTLWAVVTLRLGPVNLPRTIFNGTPGTLSSSSVEAAITSGCFLKDTAYVLAELEQGTLEADAAECQRRCAVVPGCAHFTYGPDHICRVHSRTKPPVVTGPTGKRGSITGPPWCEDGSGAGTRSHVLELEEVARRSKTCFSLDTSFDGKAVQTCSKEVSPLECQTRCAFVKACGKFVFHPNHKCCLWDESAKAVASPFAVAGPKRCGGKETEGPKRAPPRCPLDLGPPPTQKPPANLSLDACAAAFPAFLTYLDRRFGHARTLGRMSEEEKKKIKHEIMSFKVTPNMTVDLEVRGVIRSGSAPPTVSLRALENGTVVVKYPGWDRCPHLGHKLCGLQKLLSGVLGRHGHLLLQDLQRAGGTVNLLWRGADADFPSNPRNRKDPYKGGLPLHGYSSDGDNYDIAMPDFTFENYPEIRSHLENKSWTSNSWEDVKSRLRQVPHEKDGFVFRGKANWRGSRKLLQVFLEEGPPPFARRLLKGIAPEGFDIFVGQYVAVQKTPSAFMTLYEQCKRAFTFHVSGTHYSAMLKYKMACGQTVFIFGDVGEEEFWYDAIKDGENVFFITERTFWEDVHKALQPSRNPPLSSWEKAACVAARAQRLADTYLSQHGIDCYVMLYLARYYLPLVLRFAFKR